MPRPDQSGREEHGLSIQLGHPAHQAGGYVRQRLPRPALGPLEAGGCVKVAGGSSRCRTCGLLKLVHGHLPVLGLGGGCRRWA